MGSAALVAICTAHGCRADSLQPRALIDKAGLHKQVINIDVLVLLRCVSNGRLHDFFDLTSRFRLVRELQRHKRLVDVLSSNQVNYQPRLLRRHTDESARSFTFHLSTRFRSRRSRTSAGTATAGSWRSTGRRYSLVLSAGSTVTLEAACRRELTEFVTNHVFRYIHWYELFAVVHRNRVAHHLRNDC